MCRRPRIDRSKQSNIHNIPIHSRMVFNSSVNLGCEMTWPKPRYCDLNEDCGEIIEVYRCPMLWGDDSDLMQYDIQDWWANFIKSGETYGIDNLVDFPTNLPEDQHHLVCSQTTTQSLLYTLSTNGINCTKLFPGYWLVASDDDNAMVTGKVSPLDQSKVFTDLGWRVSLI